MMASQITIADAKYSRDIKKNITQFPDKIKTGEFKKTLKSKLEQTKEIPKNTSINNKTHNRKKTGTNLADDKLKGYAIQMEHYLISQMWQKASSSVQAEEGDMAANKFYSDVFIDEMVKQAYGDEGGPLAEGFYENLKVDYGKLIEENNNVSKNSKER